jgi:hypothetical protein
LNAHCPDKRNKVQRAIAIAGSSAAVFAFGNDTDDSVEIVCRPCGLDIKPVSPAAPTKSMVKVGVWCLVILFALSIATAVCLDGGNSVPANDFTFAAFTTDGALINADADGKIESVSRIPA